MAYNHMIKFHSLNWCLDSMRIMEYKAVTTSHISQSDTPLNQITQHDWVKNRDTVAAHLDR
jgi:hypothetical protein